MRCLGLLLLLGETLCLTGCFSLDSAYVRRTGEENVNVYNDGWYLFDSLPIVTGNADPHRFLPFVFFRNDATMEIIQDRFFSYAQEKGRAVSELNYLTQESVLFEVPGLSFPLPIPYLLTNRKIQLSGVLK